MDNEENDGDANAGICDVERRPGMRERHVQVKQQKIYYVTVEQAIRQISKNTSEQQGQRNIPPAIRDQPNRFRVGRLARFRPGEKKNQRQQCRGARDRDEKCIAALERTERGPGVGDVYQMKKIWHHDDRPVWINGIYHQVFGDPVGRVERKRKKENVFHWPFVMSSEVEASLNISARNTFTNTEIIRDSSTSVGMTKIISAG
jgi:hypothetical protein